MKRCFTSFSVILNEFDSFSKTIASKIEVTVDSWSVSIGLRMTYDTTILGRTVYDNWIGVATANYD